MTTPMSELPPLPKKRRLFICTKCGSSKCVQGQEDLQFPDCNHCFYQGFAEDAGYNDSEMQTYARAAIEAATEQGKRQPPVGYQLVPIEPTDQMLHALIKEWDSVGGLTMYENYRAMLSAAPATPPTRGM